MINTLTKTKKKKVHVWITLHHIQADIITALQAGKIDLNKDTLRHIASLTGEPKCSPNKIKHHLQQLVKLGVINIIDGQYSYTKTK